MVLIDQIGPIFVYRDPKTQDVVLAVQTEIGKVAANLTAERALQVGVALVRESGQRRAFTSEEKHDEEIEPDRIPASGPVRPIDLFGGPRRGSEGSNGKPASSSSGVEG